jgi:hypothetical protein
MDAFKTRREYIPVCSTAASMRPTVLKASTRQLPHARQTITEMTP